MTALYSQAGPWAEFRWFLLGIVALCFLPSGHLLLYGVDHRGRFEGTGIDMWGPMGTRRPRFVGRDLRKASFKPLRNELHLISTDGRKVRVSSYMVGLAALVAELRNWPRCELDLKGLPLEGP